LLLLTLLRNGARSSRAAVAVRVVAWGVADINLGEVVVRVITEGSLESNLLILVVVVGSRGSRLRSGRGRHFDFLGFCCFVLEDNKKKKGKKGFWFDFLKI
jgi:hypothetical protein